MHGSWSQHSALSQNVATRVITGASKVLGGNGIGSAAADGIQTGVELPPYQPVTRQCPWEKEKQGHDRATYCARRAVAKVASDTRSNTVVAEWFPRACERIVAGNPHVFTNSAQEHWKNVLTKEAGAKRAAEATSTNDVSNEKQKKV